ncbi:MAG: anthranilate synthase component I family protein, partial [Asticcacaulis sp.]
DHSRASLPPPLAHAFVPDTPDATYQAGVARLVAHIGDGDVFQANLTRGWTGTLPAGTDLLGLARHLYAASPAPYSAVWSVGDHTLICNSPERFLSVSPSGVVSTCPIKGTRPRHADPAQDAAHVADLPQDPKERAENLMIVDLMRNDLGRVCAPGSVRVTRLFEVETFANVHHLVSEVQGQLVDNKTARDLLLDSFPPGSITGAPKVRAMQLLNTLEPPRGPYCGSLFWIGDDGAMDSSVLIRTLALTRTEAGFAFRAAAGAGIVADSRPEAECAETHTKISRIRAALILAEDQP